MRVLFADDNHPILIELLTAAGHVCDLHWGLSAAELIKILPAYDALVIRSKFKITSSILDAAVNLKCIGRVGAGLENIDVAYAQAKGVHCINVPEGNRDAVGEHAVGMLLMLLNHLKRADAEVRQGIWRRAENRGTEISGKCVGIIGYGQMGSSFAKKISGFGCEIIAYDKYKSAFSDDIVKAVSLEQLLQKADIISLHVPLSVETKGMVDAAFLNSCSKSVYVINTARGPCVNTSDLLNAIKSGKVLGACLDVLEYESVSFENISAENLPETFRELIASDRVVLSPHIAGWTHESNYKMSKLTAERMIAVLAAKS